MPRGFAFIDMSTSKEAEEAQRLCNHKVFEGQEIRVSFGMPCRPGACILQPKNVPFNTLWSTNVVPQSLGVICPQDKIFVSFLNSPTSVLSIHLSFICLIHPFYCQPTHLSIHIYIL